jgi:UDP-N-acetyl-D-galactosamine dehydrogenase
MDFSVNVHITDVYASPNEVAHEYRLTLLEHISDNYDAVIVAVAHEEYKTLTTDYFKSIMREKPILYDIKGIYQRTEALHYWRL